MVPSVITLIERLVEAAIVVMIGFYIFRYRYGEKTGTSSLAKRSAFAGQSSQILDSTGVMAASQKRASSRLASMRAIWWLCNAVITFFFLMLLAMSSDAPMSVHESLITNVLTGLSALGPHLISIGGVALAVFFLGQITLFPTATHMYRRNKYAETSLLATLYFALFIALIVVWQLYFWRVI